jgi:Glu-tRNA(Gln) amidotransferase subunit E-like FAD-binding protein
MNRDEKNLFYLNELEKIITIMSDNKDWNNKIISEQVGLLKLKNDEYSKLISDMTSVIVELKAKNKLLVEENSFLKNK